MCRPVQRIDPNSQSGVNTMSATIVQTLRVWQQRAAARKSLRQHIQWANAAWIERDIGLMPGSLDREAHKPFWQA